MALPELPQSRYATAAATRARTVGDIALDKYDAGSAGVMGSYAQAAKEKMAASSMRMKERFDPLNMVQGLTGSRLLTTAAGRMMGRKSEDVDYFRDKATQRDTARNPGGYQDIAAAAKDKVQSEGQKKLLESQTKINNLVLTGKTTLYPKEDIVDGLNDLYDLIDERMPVGGGVSYASRAGQESQAVASPVAAGGGGSSLGDLGTSVAENLGKKALKAGGRALRGAGNLAMRGLSGAGNLLRTAATPLVGSVGLGTLATGGAVAAATTAPLVAAALKVEDNNIVADATPRPIPSELQKDPKYGYLKDLTSYDPKPFLNLNYDKDDGTRAAKAEQFIRSMASKIPAEDRAEFTKMIDRQVLGGKNLEPNLMMQSFRDLVLNYMNQKVNSKKTGSDASFVANKDLAQTNLETEANRQSDLTAAAARTASTVSPEMKDVAIPSSYKGDLRRFQADISKAAQGNATSLARLKAAGVDAEGKPLQSTQTVAPIPAVENNMNNLEQARTSATTQQASAPVIINAGGGGQGTSSSQSAPAVPPPGTATTNGTVNRFEDKLMGGNADYVP